jgi:hypothetical protein
MAALNLVEHVEAPTYFTTGLATVEVINGNFRFTLYEERPNVFSAETEHVIACRIIMPSSAVPAALAPILELAGREFAGPVWERLVFGKQPDMRH